MTLKGLTHITHAAPLLPGDMALEGDAEKAVFPTGSEKKLGGHVSPIFKVTADSIRDKHIFEELIFTGNLCHTRKVPEEVCLPETPQQVIDLIKSAKARGLPLTVKNGGHSYAGYCLNDAGIVLDMRRFNQIEVHSKETPKTIRIGGGCLWKDVYDHLDKHGHKEMVVGGQCPTVGVSGFILGGGISPFSRRFGLGIDSVRQIEVVTATEEHLTISRDAPGDEGDLFWAMMGGGGGNFGVLVSFTVELHTLSDPFGRISCGKLTWELPRQQNDFNDMMNVFNQKADWDDKLTIDPMWRYKGVAGEEPDLLAYLTVIYDGPWEECRKKISILTDFGCKTSVKSMQWRSRVSKKTGESWKHPSFHHHVSFVFAHGAITPNVITKINNLMVKSRETLTKYDRLVQSHFLWGHIGEKTTAPAKEETAFYWRDAHYVANFKLKWTRPGLTPIMLAFLQEVEKELRPHTIEGRAAYVNYIDSTLEDWEYAYYGENYPRLCKVKKRWDPTEFFKFEQSIKLPKDPQAGNEDKVNEPRGFKINSH